MAGPNSAPIMSRNPPAPSQRLTAARGHAAGRQDRSRHDLWGQRDVTWTSPLWLSSAQSVDFAHVAPVERSDDVFECGDAVSFDEHAVLVHVDVAVRHFHPLGRAEEAWPRLCNANERAACVSRKIAVRQIEQDDRVVAGVEKELLHLVWAGNADGDSRARHDRPHSSPVGADGPRAVAERQRAAMFRRDRSPARARRQTS